MALNCILIGLKEKNNYIHDLFGPNDPTTSTVGVVGQDYTNTSTGDKFHLIRINPNGDYIWESYSNSTEIINIKNDLDDALDEIDSLKDNKVDKVNPAVAGHLVTLDVNGNIVDSGKGVNDVGKLPTILTVTLPASGWANFGLKSNYDIKDPIPGYSITGIYYCNGFYLAALWTIDNYVTLNYAYSTDLNSWELKNFGHDDLGTTYSFISNGNRVIGLIGGSIFYSDNGINWFESTNSPNSAGKNRSLASANGKFIIACYSTGELFYSNDGISWESSTIPSYENFVTISYANNKYFLVENFSSRIDYSENLINWTESHIGNQTGSYHWSKIVYGNGIYVAKSSASNRFAYSYDAITWTMNYVPSSLLFRVYGNNIIYYDNKFIVSDSNAGSDGISAIGYSYDGINWFADLNKTTKFNSIFLDSFDTKLFGWCSEYDPNNESPDTQKVACTVTFDSSGASQTVSVPGAIANESAQIVHVSPNPVESNINQTMDCGVYCTAQGNDTLTFTAFDDTPTEDIVFNVILQDLL